MKRYLSGCRAKELFFYHMFVSGAHSSRKLCGSARAKAICLLHTAELKFFSDSSPDQEPPHFSLQVVYFFISTPVVCQLVTNHRRSSQHKCPDQNRLQQQSCNQRNHQEQSNTSSWEGHSKGTGPTGHDRSSKKGRLQKLIMQSAGSWGERTQLSCQRSCKINICCVISYSWGS